MDLTLRESVMMNGVFGMVPENVGRMPEEESGRIAFGDRALALRVEPASAVSPLRASIALRGSVA